MSMISLADLRIQKFKSINSNYIESNESDNSKEPNFFET